MTVTGGLAQEIAEVENIEMGIAASIAELIDTIEREVEQAITSEFNAGIYSQLVISIDGPGHIWVDQQESSNIPTWTLAYIHGIVESVADRYLEDFQAGLEGLGEI